MTPIELKQAAAVMLAAAEGKKIQGRIRVGDRPWHDYLSPEWDWIRYDYRIAPEPRRVWIKWKKVNTGTGFYEEIISSDEHFDGAIEFVEVIKT